MRSDVRHLLIALACFAATTSSFSARAEGPTCEALFAEPQEQTEQVQKPNEMETKRDHYLKEVQRLNAIEQRLLKRFVGWDDEIRNLMSAARAISLEPDMVTKPFVVPIMSFPGYGKTTLMQEFLREMGWTHLLRQVDVPKGAMFLPTDDLRSMGRSPQDKDMSAQGVLAIDEVQNLMTQKEFAELEQLLKDKPDDPKAQAFARAKDEIKASNEFWWQATGNGTVQMKADHEPHYYVEQLGHQRAAQISAVRRLEEARKNLSDAIEAIRKKKTDPTEALTEDEEDSLHFKRQALERAQESVDSPYALEGVIKNIREDQPGLLGDKYSEKSSVLKDLFMKDPEAFIEMVEKNSKTMRTVPVQEFKRIIILVMGNPNEIIEGITEQLEGARIEPDTLRGLAMKIRPQDMQRWFYSIFGNTPGWNSRFNLSAWKMVLPFSNAQWREMIDRRLTEFSDRFTGKLHEMTGAEVALEFDDSVRNMLYRVSVDAVQGPRTFYPKSTEILASVITEIRAQVAVMPPETRPEKLVVSFDPNTSEAVITEVLPESEKRFMLYNARRKEFLDWFPVDDRDPWKTKVKIGVNEEAKIVAPKANESLTRRRQALHQAGHAVVGMALFKSLPMLLTRSASSADTGISDMWREPDLQHHEFKRKQLMTLLGGYVAENVMMGEAFSSDAAKTDLLFAEALLREIKGDLESRGQMASFMAQADGTMKLEDILPHSLATDALYRELAKDGTKEIMRSAVHEIRTILKRHERLAGAIATKLIAEPEIDAQEMRRIVKRFWSDSRMVRMLPPKGDQKQVLESEPGDHGIGTPEVLDHDFSYRKRGFWESLFKGD